MWKVKRRNNINTNKSLKPFTSLNLDYKNIEEVYKLDFSNHNTSHKTFLKMDLLNGKKIPDFIQLHKSIERVKKFLPNLADKLNILKTKNLEKKLIKRFENQEKEKIMKEDLRQVNNKRNKIKKSISDNFLTYQKLDNQISDIKLSLFAHEQMMEHPILLSPNKNNRNKKTLFGKRTFSENNIERNKESKANKIKNDYQKRTQMFYENLKKKNEEISEMKKNLPNMELNRKEVLSKLSCLEKEKKDLKIIKNDISEELYNHYLDILKEGTDTRNQGFSYIVQELFNLDKRVLLSYFPDFLDYESIEYILNQAKLKLKLERKNNKMKELKRYFSQLISTRKNKKKKSIIEENKKMEDKLINNNSGINDKVRIFDYYSNKNPKKINKNKYNNSLLNSNGFSIFNSTERTAFSNFNNDNNLNSTEISFNNIDKNRIKKRNNNFNELNNFNKTTSDLKLYSEINEKKLIKNKLKSNFYRKLSYKYRMINSPSPAKKLSLSNYNSIPEKLSVTQVENYLKSQENGIIEKNIHQVVEYFKLDNKIKKIKNELEDNKKEEMERIFKKYLKREYSQQIMSEKQKVLSALIGEDNVQSELAKQIKKTKLYFDSIKKFGLMNNQANREYKVNQISHSFLKKMGK